MFRRHCRWIVAGIEDTAFGPLLGKVANHAVFGNIGPVGQIHLPGNILRRHDSGFKLGIVNKCSTVYANLHAADYFGF